MGLQPAPYLRSANVRAGAVTEQQARNSQGGQYGGHHRGISRDRVLDRLHFRTVVGQRKARHFPEGSSSEITDVDHRAGHLPPVDREWPTCSDMSQGRAAVVDQVVGKVAQREPAQLTALVWLAILRRTTPLVDSEEEGGTAAAR